MRLSYQLAAAASLAALSVPAAQAQNYAPQENIYKPSEAERAEANRGAYRVAQRQLAQNTSLTSPRAFKGFVQDGDQIFVVMSVERPSGELRIFLNEDLLKILSLDPEDATARDALKKLREYRETGAHKELMLGSFGEFAPAYAHHGLAEGPEQP